jgi:hypothetical protein
MNWQAAPNLLVHRARGIDHNALVEYISDGWEWTLTFIHLYLIMTLHRSVQRFASYDEAQNDCQHEYDGLIQQDFDNPLKTLPSYFADSSGRNGNITATFSADQSGSTHKLYQQ